DWDWGVGYGYAVSKNGIHVQLANGTTFLPRYYEKTSDGWRHVDATDLRLRHSTSVTIGPDGETMVFDYSRPDVPPTYNYGKYLEGHVAQEGEVAKLNGYLKKRTPLRAEVIQWVGAEQDSVNGILYYPSDYQKGRRYPLVTVIHGGPSGVDLDAWRLSWTVFPGLLADRGAFVFRPNYHGSGNHGLEWVESIKGRYYELEVPDIVMGIEHLAEQGLIDQDSLAVMGWSNGAILTTALTVEHPEMFKVAAPGAGDVNWISDYGNCAFGVSFDNSYFRGAPWDHLDHYIEKSPLFRMPEVITPTLIHHGDRDTAVPTEQGWQYYRALQQIGKAPVRYLLYPGQPHGLQRISHQRRKVEEDLAWIDQYLFGKGSMEETVIDRALPESSPLALLVKKTQPAQVDGRYGVRIRGALAPETVALNDSLNVGRFEVTRAQFREFDKRYRVPAGTENYPANNISFERAEAYVEWLSKKTRRSYRLPTKAELGQLKAAAGSSENTLAHWTGSNPTPDELALLQQTLSSVSADDLLMAVGSRPAGNSASKTKPLVFDTNGNVAEWSAEGKATNGYAAGSADTYAEANDPPLRFTGLRVVGG
ncbi:MAG: prolyl oligopeptidase family serine peptidase, partial [Bacteroidota bacterium]